MCALSLGGCTSTLANLRGHQNSHVEEMRTEIADLKHSLHGTEVEVKLLEERLESQESHHSSWMNDDVAALQKKILYLEKSLEKLSTDIRSLMAYANQTTTSLSQYRDQIIELDQKLQEAPKLRPSTSQKYIVKAGDSLVKIAHKHQVTLDTLKRANHLTSDKIITGQQLLIPHD